MNKPLEKEGFGDGAGTAGGYSSLGRRQPGAVPGTRD